MRRLVVGSLFGISLFALGLGAGPILGLDDLWTTDSAASTEGLSAFLGRGKGTENMPAEVFSVSPSEPSGWIFADNDSTDGTGHYFLIVTANHEFPGESATVEHEYKELTNAPTTLAAFKSWIVTTYGHIATEDDFTVLRIDVSEE